MKTVSINVYKFNELSEEAKQKALTELFDLNVDFEWWESAYEDAANIGIEITSSDIDRKAIEGVFLLSACEVAANIFRDHGEECETYKDATNFMEDWQPVFDELMKEPENLREVEENIMDIENAFLKLLLEDYLIMLEHDYDYRTSKEAIIETIEANDYDFTEDGKLY